MSQQNHDEFAARGRQGRLEPLQLVRVNAPGHARVDGDQGEMRGLDLEERSVLEPGGHAVFLAQQGGPRDELVDTLVRRAGEVLVGLDARVHCRPGGGGRQERGVEALERVVPVMIAGDRVNRLIDPFEREPELRLVVIHGPRRVDDVRGDDYETHCVLP